MLVLHIGYAKAATTFLQKRVFPNVPQVHYAGRYYGNDITASRKADWVYEFTFEDKISIDRIAHKINEGMTDKSAVNLVSHEVLLRPYKKYRSLQRIKELENHFDEIKVIVSIRNQSDIVLSRSVHDRAILDVKHISDALDFEGVTDCQWPWCSRPRKRPFWVRKKECACRKTGAKSINVPFYDYMALLCLLRSLFGEKNVHFIVSEELRENCAAELDRLTRFLGVSPIDPQAVNIISDKRDNVRQELDLYDRSQTEFVSSGTRIAVFDYFREANAVLSELLQMDLKRHGYF